jgi:dTDP-4-dehydrorhamnose reductase
VKRRSRFRSKVVERYASLAKGSLRCICAEDRRNFERASFRRRYTRCLNAPANIEKRRLLVIGAGGFLGMYASRIAAASGAFAVIPAVRSLDAQRSAAQTATLEISSSGTDAITAPIAIDIADAASVDSAFQLARPDAVLLLAAIADIDRCEQAPEAAFAVNVKGAGNVASACTRSGARLLYTSSAAVFDGTQTIYREDDLPSPVSVYGKSKMSGESIVREKMPAAVILRFAMAIGLGSKPGSQSLLDMAMSEWKAGRPVSFWAQEDRNPIDAATLAKVMIDLLGADALSGVYNVGASDTVSRYELALRLAARAGISADLVMAREARDPGRAQRGQHYFLVPDKLAATGLFAPPTTDEVVARCFR